MTGRARPILFLGIWLVAATWACASGAPEPGVRCLVDTGHVGPVGGLEFDEGRGLLFSAGDDGTVRMWDASTGSLVRKLAVTRLGAGMLAVNPAATQVAVIVSDGTGSFFLSVWDWEDERQVFRVPLKDEPLFLRFSPVGGYLLYGESSWESLKILRASDGAQVDFHPEGFGIVGFAEMSRSERTIMTYQASGRISYWDLATGRLTLDMPTVPYLSGVRISRDRSFLAGSTGIELVVLDAVSGAVRGRVPLPAIVSLDIASAGDEIACVSGLTTTLSRWSVRSDTLAALPAGPAPSTIPSLVRYGTEKLFLAGSRAGLASFAWTGEESTFGQNKLASVTGMDAANGIVAIGSASWVRVFESDRLGGAQSLSTLRTQLAENPFAAAVGLAFIRDSSLLAWRTDSGLPGLALWDVSAAGMAASGSSAWAPASGSKGASFVQLSTGFRAPLTDLGATEASALGIETGGVVRLTDLATGVSRFDVRISGAAAAVEGLQGELLVGRNSAAASEGSLVRVDMRTGETVAIKDRNLFTFSLLLDRGVDGTAPRLFTLGIDGSGATNLLLHDGPGFERETLIDTVAEVDIGATLALDPDTRMLYASLGRDRLISWDGEQLQPLLLGNAVPLRLASRSSLLFSLNKDSTVTVADSATGESAEISLFADGEWCVLFHDGRYAASPGGDIRVRVFVDGVPMRAIEDYRMRL